MSLHRRRAGFWPPHALPPPPVPATAPPDPSPPAGRHRLREPGPARPEAVLTEITTILDDIASRFGGGPASVVRAELAKAWHVHYGCDLDEPTLTSLTMGLQGRQPWPLSWRSTRRRPSRHAARPGESAAPERPLSAVLELPATERGRTDVHGLIRHTLDAWGLGTEQVAEDTHLLGDAMLSTLLDQTVPGSPVRVTLTHRTRTLAVDMVGEYPADGALPPDARKRLAITRTLLTDLARHWSYDPHHSGVQLWCELAAPVPLSDG